MTLQCGIIFITSSNITTERDSIWTRDGILATAIPNHRLVWNSTTGTISNLLITNVTLADDNTVYTCTDNGVIITSSVVLNVTGTFLSVYVSTRMCAHMHVHACNTCRYMY